MTRIPKAARPLTDADAGELRADDRAGTLTDEDGLVFIPRGGTFPTGATGRVFEVGVPVSDPAGEYVLVQIGKDVLPFAPADLLTTRPLPPGAPAAPAKKATAKKKPPRKATKKTPAARKAPAAPRTTTTRTSTRPRAAVGITRPPAGSVAVQFRRTGTSWTATVTTGRTKVTDPVSLTDGQVTTMCALLGISLPEGPA